MKRKVFALLISLVLIFSCSCFAEDMGDGELKENQTDKPLTDTIKILNDSRDSLAPEILKTVSLLFVSIATVFVIYKRTFPRSLGVAIQKLLESIIWGVAALVSSETNDDKPKKKEKNKKDILKKAESDDEDERELTPCEVAALNACLDIAEHINLKKKEYAKARKTS